MEAQNTNTLLEMKQQAALAAVLFLAPAVMPTLQANEIEILEEDRGFIESYIQYGMYILYTVWASLLVRLLGQLFSFGAMFWYIAQGLIIFVIILVAIWVFAIFRKREIVIDKKIARKEIWLLRKKIP